VEGEVWIDGSVENDLPTQRLAELFNVNHFIVCQVNPHVYPFMRKASQSQNGSWASRAFAKLVQLSTMEVKHRLDQLSELSVLTDWIRMAQSISSQQYTGDITILPTIRWSDFIRLVQNPSSEQVMEATLRGEMATWPLVSIIRDHVRIELALDRLIYQLRLEQWTTQTKDTTSGASMIRRSSLHDMRPPGFFLVGSDSESLSE
jgi:predicted acylesterase/phospholipase RssA